MNAEDMRKQVLEDPRTAEIAANLGVDLEEYVEQVVHFATHPDETPEFRVVKDEVLREEGFDVPTEEEMDAWFEAVERGTLVFTPTGEPDTDGFGADAREEKKRILSAALSSAQQLAAPDVEEKKGEIRAAGVLKQQLLDQRMNRQMRGLPVRQINRK